MSLVISNKPTASEALYQNIDHLADNWRRTTRAVGGYWTGSFKIQRGSMMEWTEYYNTWMGNVITESTYGITSWEGIVWQLDLVKNGINYRRTFDPALWHNKVNVTYTDENGIQQNTGTIENTSSSDIYGLMVMDYVAGGMSSAGATALRARALAQYAWPVSRTAGGITVGEGKPSANSDGLYITATGFWSTLNWRVYTSDIIATAASTALGTLIGTAEFVTAGRVETNALSINSEGDNISQRVGDLVQEIVVQGDASGNVWKGGVYADKKFVYEQAPTAVEYVYRDGILYNQAGGIVVPELLEPGFYVRDTNAPTGTQPPGTSNVWDDPQVSYCDEVEFAAPNVLRLSFTDQEERIEVLLDQAAG